MRRCRTRGCWSSRPTPPAGKDTCRGAPRSRARPIPHPGEEGTCARRLVVAGEFWGRSAPYGRFGQTSARPGPRPPSRCGASTACPTPEETFNVATTDGPPIAVEHRRDPGARRTWMRPTPLVSLENHDKIKAGQVKEGKGWLRRRQSSIRGGCELADNCPPTRWGERHLDRRGRITESDVSWPRRVGGVSSVKRRPPQSQQLAEQEGVASKLYQVSTTPSRVKKRHGRHAVAGAAREGAGRARCARCSTSKRREHRTAPRRRRRCGEMAGADIREFGVIVPGKVGSRGGSRNERARSRSATSAASAARLT